MTVAELRDKYLRFFVSKGHQIFPSGSLVPYDVTGKLDESLLFNGAGMIQFKPYFLGTARPDYPKLATAQKCLRTGDIEEVGDNSHLTFFEMMGNFSFGDYFAAQAIAYSWEFMTAPEWLGLDPHRLAYTIFEKDDEAYDEWSRWLIPAGIKPETRIFRLDEETNFWPAGAYSNGPPGPCGPNSEMFYWVAPEPPPVGLYRRDDFLRDEESGKWLEFWNDVFIQYDWRGYPKTPGKPSDGYVKDEVADLPYKSVDTGLGLERAAVVLSGGAYKSVYDTDAFMPLLEAIRSLVRPGDHPIRAIRIVADHVRAACFCLADGILPGNNGRAYVLRRLIRRAVLSGYRSLGLSKPFMRGLVATVVDTFGTFYTELAEKQTTLEEIVENEEALFRRTLERGVVLLTEKLAEMPRGSTLPGREAFDLYETFGFPLEVTSELCHEHGIRVDIEGYELALAEAQQRSRSGQDRQTVYGGVEGDPFAGLPATRFLGYEKVSAGGTVLHASPIEGGGVAVALDQTPFYAAAGGQISDQGAIRVGAILADVKGVAKHGGVIVHSLAAVGVDQAALLAALADGVVEAAIDAPRRKATQRNHTATHLLQASLRTVLGAHVTQAGSYVGPDRLRFDFTHGKAVTAEELARIERLVNAEIWQNTPVTTYVDLPIDEAKSMGAMALFGEKYGDKVRMVEVGEFSRELCGGTHVRALGEIGLFKIVSEGSAASGVRRIEAMTGEGAYEWTLEEESRLRDAAALLKASPREIVGAVEKILEVQRELKQRLERLRTQGAGASSGTVTDLGAVELLTDLLTEGEQADATLTADRLADGQPKRIVVVALASGGKVTFVAKAGEGAQKAGAHAGNLVRELAKLTGGGGGGGPAFATAGGRQPERAAEALSAAADILRAQL
ncbi:MAG: alanine--tRNA ligase [Fimbriimonadaceae bacterium]